jgi:hypothetical protein
MLQVVSSWVIELLETVASTICRGSGVSFDRASIMCRTVTRNDPGHPQIWRPPRSVPGILTVLPLCYRHAMAVRKKRSISVPPELDAEIAAAAQAAGMSYSAWLAQTAQKEFIIRAGLEAVSQYESEHGGFTPEEIAEADEWAARVIQPGGTRRSA